jgi:4-hydroxybutyrate dehydrogenase
MQRSFRGKTMRANLQLPRLQLHDGAVQTLPLELQFHGVSKPLVMTDKGVVACGIVEQVLRHAPSGTVVYDGVTESPVFANCDGAMAVYVASRCDCIVAVGGGSVIDAAKLTAVIAGHGGRAADFAGHSERVTRAVVPLIVVPTTAGTGSECSPGAGVHPDPLSLEAPIGGPFIIPKSAICDPALTISLPPSLTAATGIDALTHCVEGFMAVPASPLIDVLALDGIRRICANIELGVSDGGNRAARLEMMTGAFASGVSIQKGLGPAHAIANSCGDQGVHHGKLSAIGLLASLQFLETREPAKLAEVHRAMDLARDVPVVVGLRQLMERLNLPTTLRAAGYRPDQIDRIAKSCAVSHFNMTCPHKPAESEYATLIASVLG